MCFYYTCNGTLVTILCLFLDNDKWFDQGKVQMVYDNEGLAFQCLAMGGGDVAFIHMDLIPKYLGII